VQVPTSTLILLVFVFVFIGVVAVRLIRSSTLTSGAFIDQVQSIIELKNVWLSVSVGSLSERKVILTNVTLNICSGLVALMGPSGSGKSSLLKVLLDEASGRVDGTVAFHLGTPGDGFARLSLPDIRDWLGYVPQADIIATSLTTLQNVGYSARLRSDVRSDSRQMVKETIQALDMTRHQDTRSAFLSGGQQKRVSTLMELASQPSLIFADEVTSGQDSGKAFELVSALRRYADRNKTVVTVIHQPSEKIFNLFDDVVFFGQNGHIVFAGSANKFDDYLSRELHLNVTKGQSSSDYFLEYVSDAESSARAAQLWLVNAEKSEWMARSCVSSLNSIPALPPALRRQKLSFSRQVIVHTMRQFWMMWGTWNWLLLAVLNWLITRAINILLNPREDNAAKLSANIKMRNFLLVLVVGVLSTMEGALFFTEERALIQREHRVGVNLLALFFGKQVLSVLMCAALPFLQTWVWTSWIEIDAAAAKSDIYWALAASHFYCQSIGMLVGIGFDPSLCLLVVVFMVLVLCLVSGFAPQESDISNPFFKILLRLSFARHLLELATVADCRIDRVSNFGDIAAQIRGESGYSQENVHTRRVSLVVLGLGTRLVAAVHLIVPISVLWTVCLGLPFATAKALILSIPIVLIRTWLLLGEDQRLTLAAVRDALLVGQPEGSDQRSARSVWFLLATIFLLLVMLMLMVQ
jgi:ABC-type multidrug transport system ATPase subunit